MHRFPSASGLVSLLCLFAATHAAAQAPLPAVVDLGTVVGQEGAPVFRVYGAATEIPAADARLRSLATGDFNGDGYDDLLAASGRAAYIVYGTPSTPPSTLALSLPATITTRGVTKITTSLSDAPISTVAAGDFNGDGIADAVLADRVRVYIVYGSITKPGIANGLGSEVVVAATGTASATGETRITFGYYIDNCLLAAGDFNGDTYTDLVITDQNSALLHVLYGVPGKLGFPNGAGSAFSTLDIYGPKAGETFFSNLPTYPSALAVGDLDGDGYDDLCFGMALANTPGNVDAGVVSIVYGKPAHWGIASGPGHLFDFTTAGIATPTNNGETRILGDDATDLMGTALACGDLNGDGFAELLLGAPQGDSNAQSNNGEVYLLYGSATRPGVATGAGRIIDLNTNGTISASGETRILSGIATAQLGTALSVCDLNGDGLDDMVLAAPQTDLPGLAKAGALHIFYGSDAPYGSPSGSGSILNLFNEAADVQVLGPNANATLGIGLNGAGDFNLDGFADLMLSAAVDTRAGTATFGSANILYGAGTAESATATTAFAAGFTAWKGLGGSLAPVLRAQMQFDDGEAGTVTIALDRAAAAALAVNGASPLPPLWQIAVERPDWTEARLALQYTDTDLELLEENTLGIWTAAAPEGPWTAPDQILNVLDNTITARIFDAGYFLVAPNFIPVTITRSLQQSNPTDKLPVVFAVEFESPVTGLEAGDFVYTGTANVSGAELTGSGMHYTLKVYAVANDGTVRPELPSSKVSDDLGRTNARSTTIENEVGFGGYPPLLTLLGANPTLVSCQQSFVEPGFVATDGLEGDLHAQVQWEDSPLSGDPQQFTRTYTVADAFGLVATATRTVVLTASGPPAITRIGAATITVPCGTPYEELGATAVETCSLLPLEVLTYNFVNSDVLGDYIVLYRATDAFGRTAQISRTVRVRDTAPPELTLLGSPSITIDCHAAYADPGATAYDTCDGDRTAQIVVAGQVNPDLPGTYTLRYKVLDTQGNEAAELTRTVVVSDNKPPQLSLIGGPVVPLQCGEPLLDPGVIAVDACAGDLTASVLREGNIDTASPGDYPVTYTLQDPSGNNARTVYRTFHVADTEPPVITLNGDANMLVDCNAAFTDPGATALDRCEGDLSGSILVQGTVDPATPGQYTITYTLTDATGNVAEKRVRTVEVKDLTAPVITLNGENPLTLPCGSSYTDAGATAEDACEGDFTAHLTAYDGVVPTTAGTYTYVYAATDAAGNTATAARTVIIEDAEPPVVSFSGLPAEPCIDGPAEGTDHCFTAVIDCHADLSAVRITATDNCDAESEVLPRVDTWADAASGNATFQQRYTVQDASGNTTVFDLSIIVADSTPPVLSLAGAEDIQWPCGITFFDPGFTARDECDGDLKEFVTVNGAKDVDARVPGDYTITYSVVDTAGNEAVATRIVHIAPPCRGPIHTADLNENGKIDFSELSRLLQFYNSGGYRCTGTTSEDGYEAGPGENHACNPHNADYAPEDWAINLSEVLRMVQLYQSPGYHQCEEGEDGYCPGAAPEP